MKPLATLLLVVALSAVTTAQADLRTSQITQALDLFEDMTMRGGAAKPPLVTGATVRKVSSFRRAARATMAKEKGCGDPCRSELGLALFRLMADPSLADTELTFLQPYSNLVKSTLDIR